LGLAENVDGRVVPDRLRTEVERMTRIMVGWAAILATVVTSELLAQREYPRRYG
jgi:hypothetical protein